MWFVRGGGYINISTSYTYVYIDQYIVLLEGFLPNPLVSFWMKIFPFPSHSRGREPFVYPIIGRSFLVRRTDMRHLLLPRQQCCLSRIAPLLISCSLFCSKLCCYAGRLFWQSSVSPKHSDDGAMDPNATPMMVPMREVAPRTFQELFDEAMEGGVVEVKLV